MIDFIKREVWSSAICLETGCENAGQGQWQLLKHENMLNRAAMYIGLL
jgi:hypothetical protein